MTETCTTKDAARILGVTPRTIQLWSESGVLDYWKTPGGHRRYDLKKIEAMSANNLVSARTSSNRKKEMELESRCKILVIEDDALLLNLYNINISSWDLPIDLELSQDGYDGLLKIGSFSPDILILDLTLPSVDGFQIIGTLLKNKLLSRMKLFIVSGLSESEIANNLGNLKDISVMHKPVDFQTLRKQIESHISLLERV